MYDEEGSMAPSSDSHGPIDTESPWVRVNAMIGAERNLAEIAHSRAAGEPDQDPWTEELRGELYRVLSESYTHYGIASDNAHAIALIRDIEIEVAEQAKAHGKGPPRGFQR